MMDGILLYLVAWLYKMMLLITPILADRLADASAGVKHLLNENQ
jgi:hypothetical protein